MIDVVLFDIDGTLVDHDGAANAAVVEWSTEQGWTKNATEREISDWWNEIAERNLALYRQGNLSFQAQRRQRLREFMPLVGSDPSAMNDEELDVVFDGYLHKYEAAWRPFDDAQPTLVRLQGLARLAILSNGDQDQQVQKLRNVGLDGFFETVMTSSLLGVSKPDAQAFLMACDKLGTSPDRVLYVGDRLTIDAMPAKAAGLQAALIAREDDPGQVPQDVRVIRSLGELEL